MYTDADWAGLVVDRKSTTAITHLFGEILLLGEAKNKNKLTNKFLRSWSQLLTQSFHFNSPKICYLP